MRRAGDATRFLFLAKTFLPYMPFLAKITFQYESTCIGGSDHGVCFWLCYMGRAGNLPIYEH